MHHTRMHDPGAPAPGAAPVLTAAQARKLRARMERAVDRLIAAMDALDAPDEGAEDGGDLEPTLGSLERHPTHVGGGWWLGDYERDRVGDQTDWAAGGSAHDELEHENEHGGDVLNEPHDPEPDEEPSLGAVDALDQTWWGLSPVGDLEGPDDDLEPNGDELDESHDGCEPPGARILGGIGA